MSKQCSFPECACVKWCAVKIGIRIPDRRDAVEKADTDQALDTVDRDFK